MDHYQDFLKDDLAAVDRFLDDAYRVEGKLMGEVAAYTRAARGKMVRPAMVCLVARAMGYDAPERHHARLGAAVELFHVATLLHDDVIDNAPTRRGRPTVKARWGDDVAILFADYLYATCFDLALQVLNPAVVQVLTKTTQRMAEGEMFQIEKRGEWMTVEEYFRIIRAKTACLFSACAGLGAVLVGAEGDASRRLFDFGMNFGLAFQITDDALDYDAQGAAWGKRVGLDLEEGKQTLPLLHALSIASPEDRRILVHELENGRSFETVSGVIRKYQGIDYALEKAGEASQAALDSLDGLEESEALAILRRMTDGVVARQY